MKARGKQKIRVARRRVPEAGGVPAPGGAASVRLGQHWSYNLLDDPKRLAFVLARYAFAARLIGAGRRVLELGCSEGVGGMVLAGPAARYAGVDSDTEAIRAARANWARRGWRFIPDDFLGRRYGAFDAVVSLDVLEHIEPRCEALFFRTVRRNLTPHGMCVIGTPNATAARYASAVSRANHVNLHDARRLAAEMGRHFRKVLLFGMNDEVVHTGFSPMAHYLMAVGLLKRRP